jgi:hypothetical protein
MNVHIVNYGDAVRYPIASLRLKWIIREFPRSIVLFGVIKSKSTSPERSCTRRTFIPFRDKLETDNSTTSAAMQIRRPRRPVSWHCRSNSNFWLRTSTSSSPTTRQPNLWTTDSYWTAWTAEWCMISYNPHHSGYFTQCWTSHHHHYRVAYPAIVIAFHLLISIEHRFNYFLRLLCTD